MSACGQSLGQRNRRMQVTERAVSDDDDPGHAATQERGRPAASTRWRAGGPRSQGSLVQFHRAAGPGVGELTAPDDRYSIYQYVAETDGVVMRVGERRRIRDCAR